MYIVAIIGSIVISLLLCALIWLIFELATRTTSRMPSIGIIDAGTIDLGTLASGYMRTEVEAVAEAEPFLSLLPSSSQFWRTLRAGAFVTAYKKLPPTSAHVWCCMSNGDCIPRNDLLTNISESARICFTEDSRRTVEPPTEFELCLFAPQGMWIERDLSDMKRERERAYQVVTSGKDGRRRGAVYLPSVWYERPEWTASTLVEELGQKAGGGPVISLLEVPCYTVSTFPEERHDRGFFACVILERAFDFYRTFMSKDGSRLAYQVDERGNADYDNHGADVRIYADVVAFKKLCILLGKDDYLSLGDHLATGAGSISVLATRLSFLREYEGDTLPHRLQEDIQERLLSIVRGEELEGEMGEEDIDYSFSFPQALIALCSPPSPVVGKQEAWHIMCDRSKEFERALNKDGAFAANWLLQAYSSCSSPSSSPSPPSCLGPIILRAIRLCQEAIERPRSITEQACAAHGLLAVNIFDYTRFDFLAERWAKLQYEFNMHGGFRYSEDQPWYRTDVTSHVVEVCLLLREE